MIKEYGHMGAIQQEPWGWVVYDQTADEFIAELVRDEPTPLLKHPISAGCLVTRECNYRCEYCYGNHEGLPRATLNVDGWRSAFKRLREFGVMRVDLSGGEPLVRKDIDKIVDAALEEGLNVVLSTNGALLKAPETFPISVRLHVSLDAGTAGAHEASRIRGTGKPSTGDFSTIVNVLASSLAAGFRIRVLTAIGPHNASSLLELGELLATLGVPEWNLSRILPAGRAHSRFDQRWRTTNAPVVQQVHDMRKMYPWMRIRYSDRTASDGYFLLVLPDGSLATQYTDGRDKVSLGHINNTNLEQLTIHPAFDLAVHSKKWLTVVHRGAVTPLDVLTDMRAA